MQMYGDLMLFFDRNMLSMLNALYQYFGLNLGPIWTYYMVSIPVWLFNLDVVMAYGYWFRNLAPLGSLSVIKVLSPDTPWT